MNDDLIERAKVLADRVGGLSMAVEQLDRRSSRNEKVVVTVVIVLLLTLTFSVVVAFTLIQVRQTQSDVNAAVAREAKTRQEALCPLYRLLLGGYNPETRSEGEARRLYIEQFDVMRKAYDALDCAGPLVPPAVTVPR